MAYNPVSGAAIQYSKDDGSVADGYYLKFYIANTTTPLSMATDATGASTLVKCKLNDKGYPISNELDNDSVFIPHVDQSYRFVLYKTEADADGNVTANADVNIPSIAPMAGSETLGTAAYVDTGTAAGEVPLNSDLGTAAVLDVMTDLTDPASGSLMPPGAFGWGEDNDTPQVTDLNAVTPVGVFRCETSALNLPTAGRNGILFVTRRLESSSNIRAHQLFFNLDEEIWQRFNINGTWQSWKRLDPQAFGLGSATQDLLSDAEQIAKATDQETYFGQASVGGTGHTFASFSYASLGAALQIANRVLSSGETPELKARYVRGGIASDWVDLYHQASILGTVSQSGGVPTGAVIERGRNANGEYVKFADGTLICTQGFSSVNVTIAYGTNLFRSGTVSWTFPATYISTPNVHPSNDSAVIFGTARGVSGALAEGAAFAEASLPGRVLRLTAIGRWF